MATASLTSSPIWRGSPSGAESRLSAYYGSDEASAVGSVKEGTAQRPCTTTPDHTPLARTVPRLAKEAEYSSPLGRLVSDKDPSHDSSMSNLTRDELDAKLDRTESRVDAALARLEAQFAEFRGEFRAETRSNSRMQHLILAVIALLAVAVTASMGLLLETATSSETRLNARMDRIEGQVEALPAELRGIADSITSAITATQSGQPQTIILQWPSEPPPPEQ